MTPLPAQSRAAPGEARDEVNTDTVPAARTELTSEWSCLQDASMRWAAEKNWRLQLFHCTVKQLNTFNLSLKLL